MSFREFLKRIADKWFCLHDWDYKGKVENLGGSKTNVPESITYLYICKKCGKFKKDRV